MHLASPWIHELPVDQPQARSSLRLLPQSAHLGGVRVEGGCASPVVRVAAAIALVVGCIAGGVAATTLFPSTVETINYRAQLRLSINAEDVSQINSPTIFGNINLHFDGPGPAPGYWQASR